MNSHEDRANAQPTVGIVMGVAGVGKTSVGRRAAGRLGWDFLDGDAYHPADNVDKMSRGIALTDADRRQWLDTLRSLVAERAADDRPTVITCSALKKAYRHALVDGVDRTLVIYLKAPPSVVRERIEERTGHFFDGDLLQSQYDDLEEPESGVTIDATQPFDVVVDAVVRALSPRRIR